MLLSHCPSLSLSLTCTALFISVRNIVAIKYLRKSSFFLICDLSVTSPLNKVNVSNVTNDAEVCAEAHHWLTWFFRASFFLLTANASKLCIIFRAAFSMWCLQAFRDVYVISSTKKKREKKVAVRNPQWLRLWEIHLGLGSYALFYSMWGRCFHMGVFTRIV